MTANPAVRRAKRVPRPMTTTYGSTTIGGSGHRCGRRLRRCSCSSTARPHRHAQPRRRPRGRHGPHDRADRTRAIHAVGGIGRVHVNRWGDGGSHFHLWFYGRPVGDTQMIGFCLPLWAMTLPPIPEDIWNRNLAVVASETREGRRTRHRLIGRGPNGAIDGMAEHAVIVRTPLSGHAFASARDELGSLARPSRGALVDGSRRAASASATATGTGAASARSSRTEPDSGRDLRTRRYGRGDDRPAARRDGDEAVRPCVRSQRPRGDGRVAAGPRNVTDT